MREFEWRDEVRLILLGKSGVGKSETGSGILGPDSMAFEYCPSFCPVTEKCQREHVKRFGAKNIYVTDTPGIITSNSGTSKGSNSGEILNSLEMNTPGPNVFLLVLRADVRFTSEDVDVLKTVEEMFGEEIFKYLIIVFTRGNQLKNSDRSVDDKLDELPKEFQELYRKCHGRYVAIENPGPENNIIEYYRLDKERQRDVRTLFEGIYQLLCDNDWSYYSAQKRK